MRYLNSKDIWTHRSRVREETSSQFQPFYANFDKSINALLAVQYAFHVQVGAPAETERVQSLVQKWLYSSIFGFHASLSLVEQGFYTQSLVLNRGLMECVVSACYLAVRPKDIERLPMVSKKVKAALTMRERFDLIVPGYYDDHYGFSSEFAHPRQASHIFKIQPNGKGPYDVDLGVTFDVQKASMCMNEIIMLLAGFLKTYIVRYKNTLTYRDPSDLDLIQDAMSALLETMYGHIQVKGEETSWHKYIRPLWDFQDSDLAPNKP